VLGFAVPVEPCGACSDGVLWLAVGSQLLGLLAWYRGMAAIGVTRASQLQLAQPTLTLVWSVLLLGERLDLAAPIAAAAVMVCVGVTQRSQNRARGRTGDRIPRLFAF